VRYLSQQFVERLCGHAGLDDTLIHEIEDVVFHAIEASDRLGTDSFRELREIRTQLIHRRVEALRETIREASRVIAAEDKLRAELRPKQVRLEEMKREIETWQRDLQKLAVKGKDEKLKRLAALTEAVRQAEASVSRLKLRKQKLDELETEIAAARERHDAQWERLKRDFAKCTLTEEQWELFQIRYLGDVDEVIQAAARAVTATMRYEEYGLPQDDSTFTDAQTPLRVLRAERKKLEDELGVHATKERQYAQTQKKLEYTMRDRDKLTEEIVYIEKSSERRRLASERRLKAYRDIFLALREEQQVLDELYAPLRDQLTAEGAPTVRRLEFYVQRRVNVDEWARRGEDLLDLRKKSPFQGRGALAEASRRLLGAAWTTGGPDDVMAGLRALYEEGNFATIRELLASQVTTEAFAEWLFSTDHIHLDYGIRYDGIEIERLSPGTRGIVLLILYLAIDQWDYRPLVIDQPEENLDPKSVFDELVGYFRVARRRRQVIVVTHNANLVVNTDADQVIIASSTRNMAYALPRIAYKSGGLEDREVRDQVCRILEGGEAAFRLRERKYRLSV
jgi:AAA domain, putative AbiEii toxin, Type IV TA system